MKTDKITEKIDKLFQIALWLPTPKSLSSLMENLTNHKNYTYAHECFFQWLGQCNKAKKTLEELLENLEPLKKEQEELLKKECEEAIPSNVSCPQCGADYTKLIRVVTQNFGTLSPEVVIHCCVCGKEMDKILDSIENFIKLCESTDYVMVNGHLGTYCKDYEEIVFPRNGMCPPNIKVREYDYCKSDGEKWILACNSGIGPYHHVRFINFVK